MILQQQFDGSGFLDWKFCIKTRMGRDDCIDGLSMKPSTMSDGEYAKKNTESKEIIGSIIGTVQDRLWAKEMFQFLIEMNTRNGSFAKLNLKREIT